jgi:hypothetical protein
MLPKSARVAVCVMAFLAVVVFCNIALGIALPEGLWWIGSVAAWPLAFIAARALWRRLGTEGAFGGRFFMTVLVWAALAGAVGFCGGFFGPIIFAPGANQGPLLGIFYTGPLGFLGGGIAGAVYWLWKQGRRAAL